MAEKSDWFIEADQAETGGGNAVANIAKRALIALKEAHEDNLAVDGVSITDHRRVNPDCDYCAVIRDGKDVLRSLKNPMKDEREDLSDK